MAKQAVCFLLFFCLLIFNNVNANENPTVTIKQGTLRGRLDKSINNKNIYTFTGIPYAKPPLGPLRFKAPEPAKAWEGVFDATSNRSICAQLRYPDLHYAGTENCLYINVYSNKELPGNDKEKSLVPVIAYIHGGLFVHSSGDLNFYDPKILLDHESPLIFVTFNYRLGVIGFLSTEDSESPGNYGLKDQVLALKWIQENIAKFGGDPKRVTLMGDNAGAVSAHFHMLSPLSKGLFHGAISQSGTALTHWALNRDPIGRTHYLAELLECGNNKTSSRDIVSCLREVDAEQLIKKSQRVLKWRNDWIVPFLPTIEAKGSLPESQMFLPDYPQHLMQNKKFNPVPWLVGVTSHDGLPHSLQLMLFSNMMSDLNNDFEKFAPYYFELDGPLKNAEIAAKQIRKYYFGDDGAISMGAQLELANMHTDYYYFISLVKSAALHVMSKSPPVYVYHFSFNFRKSRLAIGVPQGDDTQYVLPRNSGGRPEMESYEDDELLTRKRLVQMIVNFVYHKNPTPDGDDTFGITWLPVSEKALNFIDFNKAITLNNTFYPERIAFWDDMEEILETGKIASKKDTNEKEKNKKKSPKEEKKDEL